ncbi:STAS/SEC14 domain-containing protein [Synechocystis salina LEGE 06099]|uniref:STAS/SEC14 domain-containing protein n=1 Tax=Synechocystis salina TaxID=945780 RepID=UPI001880B215|nr:STAS/SEC14 domain-containing protein [Synechocystis salina]MBE9203528.1 STAS/SEC14 domain-containing protein [Synechocystis salina LEGE 06099]
MITIKKSPEHVLSISLSNTVEQLEIKKIAEAFKEKFVANDRVNMVVDMSQWSDITGDAMVEDAKFELGQLGKVSRVSRMAVISNKQFVKAIINVMGSLFPMVEVKLFGPQEYDQALAFASEMPTIKTSDKPALTIIETDSPKIIGYEIDGTLTEQDIETVMPVLKEAFGKEDKIDLFARMKNFGGFDPVILNDPSLFAAKFSAIGHVRRYAVVGAPGWMKNLAGMVSSIFPIAMTFFDADQEEEAWAWLKS